MLPQAFWLMCSCVFPLANSDGDLSFSGTHSPADHSRSSSQDCVILLHECVILLQDCVILLHDSANRPGGSPGVMRMRRHPH